MRKYLKEIIICLLQLSLFYILPLFAGPTDAMGMVILILLGTLLLSVIFCVISKYKIKYLYPFFIALVFIPSVFVYYNESALIHSVWYLVISSVGMLIGFVVSLIIKLWRDD